ncbi:NlpC/P60 family protein [Niallia circulans]|uniref:NlpC/P60 family protein n=1 Tax=Niallia circulans TaxID=1397 RepID=UPI00397925D2
MFGTISHVGIYLGENQFISATSIKGIAVYFMDNTYWFQNEKTILLFPKERGSEHIVSNFHHFLIFIV